MEITTNIIWIGFFIAAYLVKVSKRGNLLIIFALIGYGLKSFVFTLAQQGMLDYSLFDELYLVLMYMPVVASVLLVVGVIMLVRSGAPTAAGGGLIQDAQGVNLATLFTPRNETNTYSQAEVLRDKACARLVSLAKSTGLEIIEQRSQAHSPSVWFRLDYVLPSPSTDLSLTASVAVDIERFDFHRFEHTFTVAVQVGAQVTKLPGVLALDDDAINRIHGHIVTQGKILRIRNRVRQWPWQIWRPRNKVQRLQRDWVPIGLALLAVLLMMIPVVGVILMAGIFLWLFLRSRRRRTYVLTSGKPFTDPRLLRWMDSWQVSIVGLGEFASPVQQGIMTRLRSGGPEGTSIDVEKIGYWGTDRWVEREQIVVRHRRAIGFIQVVSYGDVLYVAWECHLNSSSWVEEKLAAGVDRVSGLDVVANRVVAGWHRLNEYDVSDSNFLGEWMHEEVKREVKLRMAEHKIDEEIDFTVQRESRKDTLAASSENQPPARKQKTSTFKRLA